VHTTLQVILSWPLVVVGLDAANVVRGALGQGRHEEIAGGLDLGAGCGGLLLFAPVHFVREEVDEEGVLAALDGLDQVKDKLVLVLVGHARGLVGHIAGIVANEEPGLAEVLEVRVGAEDSQALHQTLVCGGRVRVGSGTGVIHHREDAGGLLLLNEIAHNLVVEELNGIPLDLFADVLLLLLFQSELDENLLQLLVHIVDTELLKAVVLWLYWNSVL